MSKQTNGLRSMAAELSGGRSGELEARVAATEFSAAAMSTVFLGTIAYARDRELAGLSI